MQGAGDVVRGGSLAQQAQNFGLARREVSGRRGAARRPRHSNAEHGVARVAAFDRNRADLRVTAAVDREHVDLVVGDRRAVEHSLPLALDDGDMLGGDYADERPAAKVAEGVSGGGVQPRDGSALVGDRARHPDVFERLRQVDRGATFSHQDRLCTSRFRASRAARG
jgi:hypothetical protein